MKPEPPTTDELLNWLEGRLSETEAAQIAQRVAVADEATQQTVSWLKAFIRRSHASLLVPPPAAARAAVRNMIKARQAQQPSLLRRLVAALAPPPPGSRLVTSGLRGANIRAVQRQLTYTTELADVVVNIQPTSISTTPGREKQLDMKGQIFLADAADGLDVQRVVVQLLREGGEMGLTVPNELGEFSFEAIPPGSYEIILSAGQTEIELAPIALDA